MVEEINNEVAEIEAEKINDSVIRIKPYKNLIYKPWLSEWREGVGGGEMGVCRVHPLDVYINLSIQSENQYCKTIR